MRLLIALALVSCTAEKSDQHAGCKTVILELTAKVEDLETEIALLKSTPKETKRPKSLMPNFKREANE